MVCLELHSEILFSAALTDYSHRNRVHNHTQRRSRSCVCEESMVFIFAFLVSLRRDGGHGNAPRRVFPANST